MNIEIIRSRYPNPGVYCDGGVNAAYSYCVGGALCLWNGYPFPFPSASDLTDILWSSWEVRPFGAARAAAEAIIHLNDSECFLLAWDVVDAALLHDYPRLRRVILDTVSQSEMSDWANSWLDLEEVTE